MLRLEVLDFAGATHWRWRLTDANGVFLADHVVELDEREWQYEAFTDLHRYLRANVVPDRRHAHETELVTQVGDWIAGRVLGPIAPAVARGRRPVRMLIPDKAAVLAYRPWELARVDGRPLVSHRASFVIDQGQPTVPKADVGERLRMLAVFSLPTGAGALNLRKERFALARMVHEIAAVHAKGIELRVLQYGATRQRLADALLEADGWDLVHLSGHGLPAGVMLEDDAGQPDLITSTDLVDLLDLASDRIKLVTLSACESAAVTAAEHLQLLGLAPAERIADGDVGSLPAVAAEVVRRLDCAVLAMRYPVADDFAIALADSFYGLVLGKRHPVADAVPLSLAQVSTTPLSLATPTVFGSRALDLRLVPPDGQPMVFHAENQRLAEFPPQPERFVGRVGPMTRATTVMAQRSGRPGVVFHGMAGAGKTACALELAYTHQESFPAMAWYAAPPEGHDITTALTDCALALERQLPGLKLAHRTTGVASWRGVLPGLTEALEHNRVLIVLDNVESLLTTTGAWRDERWAEFVHALTNHTGLSRVIMTSRVRPAGLADTVLVEPVHALSLSEAVLLAREFPHLRALIDAADDLAVRALTIVQGHPKLIELVEGRADDPELLRARLAEADQVWRERGIRLEPFLAGSDPAATDDDFLSVLSGWTRATQRSLPPDAALFFELLCCLEPDDRNAVVVEAVWDIVWQKLERPGAAPAVTAVVPPLVEQGLVAVDGDPAEYRIHPGVAETGRAGAQFGVLVDDSAADVWLATLEDAVQREATDGRGRWILHSARAVAPYLLRQRRWSMLITVNQHVLARDLSPVTIAALLPILAAEVQGTAGTDEEPSARLQYLSALSVIDVNTAEPGLRALFDMATAQGDFALASNAAWHLSDIAYETGNPEQSLAWVDAQSAVADRAGLGPWSRIAIENQRLRVLHEQGHDRQVLEAVGHIRTRIAALSPVSAERENVVSWSVQEGALELGAAAAINLELWELALELNWALRESKRNRGAAVRAMANAAFNDHAALVQLGRIDEARALLHACRETYEAANDVEMLGKTFGALARVEDRLGHHDLALAFDADSLRLAYMTPDAGWIAGCHANLANSLIRVGAAPALVLAHRLAAAVIGYQSGGGRFDIYLQSLAETVADVDGVAKVLSFEQLRVLVDSVDGVHLADFVAGLPARAPDGPAALATVLDLARSRQARGR